MRRIFEWVGGFALIAFSFYFTDKVSLMVANKSELMQEIKAVSATYEVKPENAVINIKDNSIVPGLFGRTVNNQESYLSMHGFGSFNENFLVFDYIKPASSLEDNKDKFITQGNPNKRVVSFIIENNEEIEKFFQEEKIKYDKVQGTYTESELIEIINGAKTKTEFNALNNKLKSKPKLCLKDSSDIELCKKNNYYLINPVLYFENNNLIEIKNNINPGAIILIGGRVQKENMRLILNEIEFKDLDIVHLSKLINEKESDR